MRFLADILYAFAAILYAPVALYQAVFLGKNRHGWRQRLGGVPRRDPATRRVWIHAVSLGEVNATPALVARLREAMPELDIVVSSTTDTGYQRAVQLYGADRVFRFPLDFSLVIGRALARIAPTLLVLVELEVWYNLVHQCHRRGIPVCVVNGRLTGRSARRLGRLGPFARSMFARLAWVGAQDRVIADRFVALGTAPERVEITSSLKWDTATVADRVPGMEALRDAMGIAPSVPLWVCGSTGPGEEEIILDAYGMLLHQSRDFQHRALPSRDRQGAGLTDDEQRALQDRDRQGAADHELHQKASQPPADTDMPLRLAIIPRKPERFNDVTRLIESRGFACLRRSTRPDGAQPETNRAQDEFRPRPSSVILGDTLGELRKFYALATVVFVGRSLVPMGGSDPIEVAALGKPMLTGPHMENFEAPTAALTAAGTLVKVADARHLRDLLLDVLGDGDAAVQRGQRGQQVVRVNQGATQRTCEWIHQCLLKMK